MRVDLYEADKFREIYQELEDIAQTISTSNRLAISEIANVTKETTIETCAKMLEANQQTIFVILEHCKKISHNLKILAGRVRIVR